MIFTKKRTTSNPKNHSDPFFVALQFLTILPVRIKVKDNELAGSLAFFPLVGLIIGTIGAGAFFAVGFLPTAIKAVIILAVFAVVTGGLHLDGLADSCDGLYGVRKKEERLNILRDSRIGVMGALGLILVLLLKYSIFISIPGAGLWRWLLIMPIAGRWSQVLACYFSKPARPDGKAVSFISRVEKKELVIATILAFAFAVLIAGLRGAIVLGVNFIFIRLAIVWISKKIGGMTGDTIGAVSELSEVIVGAALYV